MFSEVAPGFVTLHTERVDRHGGAGGARLSGRRQPMAREEGFFDDLARGLADGSLTRGKALRLMGAALVGGTLGSLGIGEAGADPPGCKRNGKHCTRDPQCCGNLVCVSGTCQEAQTTTTTTTPTTSTSTTPMCQPIDGTCSANGQCCSGRCAGSMCAEPCFPETVLLSNGTCARPCTSDDDCGGFPCGCTNIVGERHFCASTQSGNDCDPDLPEFCVTGELCSVGRCFIAC